MRKNVNKRHYSNQESKKKNAIINGIFFLLMIITIFGFCIGILIRGQRDASVVENRALAKFPKFSFGDFFNGKYQDMLESSLSDQMLMGESIKEHITESKAELVSSLQGAIVSTASTSTDEQDTENVENQTEQPKKEVRKIKYIPISSNVYYYGNSNYMVFKGRNVDKYKDEIDEMANVYNKRFANVDSYFYLVTNSKAINFNTVDETENPFLTYVKQTFNFKCDGLKVSSYEQYKDYFYETDHHWNYKGSYQGYKDIVELLLPGETPLEPTGTTTFDVYYYGSNARTTSIYKNKEKFTVYDFELPKFDSYVNGGKATYGSKKAYHNGNYSKEKGANHYGLYYGGDFAQVMYDYHKPEKENLLVIAPSYSNAINDLLASHFNKTYYIDLRHYKNTYEKDFNPEEFCKKNKIDKFLLLISVDHLTNGNFMLKDI